MLLFFLSVSESHLEQIVRSIPVIVSFGWVQNERPGGLEGITEGAITI